MTINEKAIYLKGLADGLNFDKETAEGKLIAALIDLCADMAKKLDEVDEDIEYLNDYIEEIDEDLGAVDARCVGSGWRKDMGGIVGRGNLLSLDGDGHGAAKCQSHPSCGSEYVFHCVNVC